MSNPDAKPKRNFKQKPPYIVFSPEGPTPPVVMHPTHGAALFAAKHMAKTYPGQSFYVMQPASKPIAIEAA